MFGPINALCTLASHAFDALAKISYPAADAMWNAAPRRDDDDDDTAGSSSEITYLDEIAGHLAAQTPLLEDIRNLLNASAAPGLLRHQRPAAAAEPPAPGGTDYLLPGAGPLAPRHLRAAAVGLEQYAQLRECPAPNYWWAIAAGLRELANTRQAIDHITK